MGEYHFRQALCVHLLSAEGALVRFERVWAREAVVTVRFAADEAERLGVRGSPESRAHEEAVLGGRPSS